MDPGQLAGDTVQNAVFYATPAVLWLLLYLTAWEDPTTARMAGFGRRTFWLLFPLGLIATSGIMPFFLWDNDVLAINVAGGLVPIILSGFLLDRAFARDRAALAIFLAVLSIESVVAFVSITTIPDATRALLAVLGVSAGIPAALGLVPLGSRSSARRASGPLALASGVLFVTFLTTTPQAGVGIVSAFPYYLIAPIAGGIVAVLVAVFALGGDGRLGLPVAYATTTFGVLVGADVLRQPPLYGSGAPGLFAIGGAGLGDLLYLSGLVAMGSAYAVLLLMPGRRTSQARATSDAPTPSTPSGVLQKSRLLAADGRVAESVATAADAVWVAAQQARRLRGLPPGERSRPWEGLPVAPWSLCDQENLEALARARPTDPRDAERAWVTANGLLKAAHDAARLPFPSLLRRSAAFGIDLGATVVPALAVWITIVSTTPGTLLDVLLSVAFTASYLGYAAYGFLYLVLAETLFGTTLGKRLLRLEVTSRESERAGTLRILVRNIPKLLPLSVVGVAGAFGIAIALKGATLAGAASANPATAAIVLLTALITAGGLLVVGLGLCALVSGLAIHLTRERQRLGDYIAGTWVVTTPIGVPPPRAPAPAAGAVRSG